MGNEAGIEQFVRCPLFLIYSAVFNWDWDGVRKAIMEWPRCERVQAQLDFSRAAGHESEFSSGERTRGRSKRRPYIFGT